MGGIRPKTKGSQSKKLTLKAKGKIMRKVKKHHNKKRKEAGAFNGRKEKRATDAGLPSRGEEEVDAFASRRAKIFADMTAKNDEKKARAERMAGRKGLDIVALQAAATLKEADFETRKRARLTDDTVAGSDKGDKDNSRKAFYREFKKVVELADVIIQVLDARDPLSCRCPDVERYIRTSNPNKRIILLLNKMDLVPREVGERWLAYFREELPTVAFKCSTQQQSARMGQKKMPNSKKNARPDADEGLQTSACLGADTLIQLLKNYCRNTGIKTAITVGVIGLPNVGKSSLINSLKRARVAQVGNTPGVTKGVQEVHLDKNIKLLDSPGIVFTSATEGGDAAAILRNCIKVEKLDDVVSPVAEILKRVPAKQLMDLYKIPAFTEFAATSSAADRFLQLVAEVRGKLKKGGVPDVRSAARVILNDWNDGRIPYFTSPPSRGNEEFKAAEVVVTWAKEFDADEVFATEKSAVIAHLPSMHENVASTSGEQPRAFFELESVGAAKIELKAMEEDSEDAMDDGEGGGNGEGAMEDDEDDDDYGAPAKKKKVLSTAAKSVPDVANAASMLYSEDGQVNPQTARANKKKLKKLAAARAAAADEEGSDLDIEDGDGGDALKEEEEEDDEEAEEEDAMSG